MTPASLAASAAATCTTVAPIGWPQATQSTLTTFAVLGAICWLIKFFFEDQ